MMDNLMFDLETLSTDPKAMVFEIAIVPFDNNGKIRDNHAHLTFNPETGVIDVDTVAWWMKQEEPCSLTTNTTMTEAEAATWIHSYLEEHNTRRLWAMPPAFDCIILTQFLKRNGYDMPIDFRQWRDLRTVRELAFWPEPLQREGHTSHNAYDGCVRQIDTLAECWNRLRSNANVEGTKP